MRSALLALVLTSTAAVAAVRTGSLTTADGVKIVYDVRGQGKTTLLFVHCWSCDRTFWKNQADAFADRYQVVTMDLAGHGESGHNRKNWTIAGLGDDVRLVADQLKLKRIILVGHSMGGPVVLEAARLLRPRVLGIIAVDTLHNADFKVTPEMMQGFLAKFKADFRGTVTSFMGSMFAKDSDPAVRQFVERKAAAADPAVAIALLQDFGSLDLPKMFREAGAPIRAINAKPPYAQPTNIEGNRKYADFDVALIDNAGHFVQLERPKEFNEAFAGFAAALAK
jgi:sigma-B regulation protein RsbQ